MDARLHLMRWLFGQPERFFLTRGSRPYSTMGALLWSVPIARSCPLFHSMGLTVGSGASGFYPPRAAQRPRSASGRDGRLAGSSCGFLLANGRLVRLKQALTNSLFCCIPDAICIAHLVVPCYYPTVIHLCCAPAIRRFPTLVARRQGRGYHGRTFSVFQALEGDRGLKRQ